MADQLFDVSGTSDGDEYHPACPLAAEVASSIGQSEASILINSSSDSQGTWHTDPLQSPLHASTPKPSGKLVPVKKEPPVKHSVPVPSSTPNTPETRRQIFSSPGKQSGPNVKLMAAELDVALAPPPPKALPGSDRTNKRLTKANVAKFSGKECADVKCGVVHHSLATPHTDDVHSVHSSSSQVSGLSRCSTLSRMDELKRPHF